MRKLFLTWQDKESRAWFPIGQLNFDGKVFSFFYIKGVFEARSKAKFQPLLSFPDFNKVYQSEELFPMFANRVMPPSRPEYRETIEYLSLPENVNDPLAFLARSGGAKVTDKFELFCSPMLENGKYRLHFFAHGLRYIPQCSLERINQMSRDDRILVSHDFQNPFEINALQLHTKDNHIIGYCPSYLLDDLSEMRRWKEKGIEICVERVNDESSPLQFRLLCRLVYPQVANYRPFTKGNYEPVASLAHTIIKDSDVTFA